MSRFGLGFIGAGGVPGNDAFTKILLHMDGSNGGTSFPDVNAGGSAHAWSPTNATTSTSAAKFGPSSMLGAAGYISTPAHADFDIGTQDAAFDFWFNNNGIGTTGYGIAGQQDSVASVGSISFLVTRLGSPGYIRVVAVNSAASLGIDLRSTTDFAGTSVWTHIAFTKSGTSFRLFVNRVQEDTTKTLDSVNASTRPFTIGRAGDAGAGFSALIDEVRLSVGDSRWTTNGTPPTGPYI